MIATKPIEQNAPLWICPCGETYQPTEQNQRHCTVIVLNDHQAEVLRSLLECVIANACGDAAHEAILQQLKN